MSQGQFWALGGSSSATDMLPSAASSSELRRCVTSTCPSPLLSGMIVGSSDNAAAAKRGAVALRCASCKIAQATDQCPSGSCKLYCMPLTLHCDVVNVLQSV